MKTDGILGELKIFTQQIFTIHPADIPQGTEYKKVILIPGALSG